jgi:hypothetical protein
VVQVQQQVKVQQVAPTLTFFGGVFRIPRDGFDLAFFSAAAASFFAFGPILAV